MAKTRQILPGFGLSLGYTLVYLSILVLHPLQRACAQDIHRAAGSISLRPSPSLASSPLTT